MTRVLGEPVIRSERQGDTTEEACELWLFALDRSNQGPFLEPVREPAPISGDLDTYRAGQCGALLGVHDGKLVSLRTWAGQS